MKCKAKRRLKKMLRPLVIAIVVIGLLWFYLFFREAKAADPNLEQYQFLEAGMCHDVKLPCVKLILKSTDFYYAIFKDGKLVAITKREPDGKEETIWGKLPLKENEKET